MSAHKHIPIQRPLSDVVNEVYCQECGEVLGIGFTITTIVDPAPKKKQAQPKNKIRGKVRKLTLSERLKLA